MSGPRREAPALEAVEESVQLLRRVGVSAYGGYAAGTLAFLWAFLSFSAHMSRNALAPARLGEYSLLLALAFLAMKTSHALFFRRLSGTLEGKTVPPSLGLLVRVALTQALIQPLALFAYPVALLLVFPFPWVAAFFQNAHRVEAGESLSAWLGRSAGLARLWPRQGFFLQLFFAGAGGCLLVNVAAAMLLAPVLLKSLLGVETVFSRGYYAFFNSTFFLLAASLAWALLHPLILAVYAWRCHQGLSARTGSDLRQALARLGARAGAAVLLCLGLVAVAEAKPKPAPAASRSKVSAPVHSISAAASAPAVRAPDAVAATDAGHLEPNRVEALLKEEISDSRYAWRLPRQPAPEGKSDSWLKAQAKKFYHALADFFRFLAPQTDPAKEDRPRIWNVELPAEFESPPRTINKKN